MRTRLLGLIGMTCSTGLLACSGSSKSSEQPETSGGAGGGQSASGKGGEGPELGGASGNPAGAGRSGGGAMPGGAAGAVGGGNGGAPGGGGQGGAATVPVKALPEGVIATVAASGTAVDLEVESLSLVEAETLTFYVVAKNGGAQPICRPGLHLVPRDAAGAAVVEITNASARVASSRLLINDNAEWCIRPGERAVLYDDRKAFLAGQSSATITSALIELSGLTYTAQEPPFEVGIEGDQVEKTTMAEADAWRVAGTLTMTGPARGASALVFPQDAEGFVFALLSSQVFQGDDDGTSDAFTTAATAREFSDYLSFVTWTVPFP